MRGNLPVPSHRRALRARLLSFPQFGFTECLSKRRWSGKDKVAAGFNPAAGATLVAI